MASPSAEQRPAGDPSEDTARRLAVLIDADNARAAVIEAVLEEVARFGEASVRRIYGDFTSTQSASWKVLLNRFSIKPMQQFAYTAGKNATDSALIIDAMDLLYTRRFDGFCLVTSDRRACWCMASARKRPRPPSARPATNSCSPRCCGRPPARGTAAPGPGSPVPPASPKRLPTIPPSRSGS
jgi:hypothetical protein